MLENNSFHAQPWMLFAGVGAVVLLLAAFPSYGLIGVRAQRYKRTPLAYRLFMRIVLAAMGLILLVFAVLIATGKVQMSGPPP